MRFPEISLRWGEGGKRRPGQRLGVGVENRSSLRFSNIQARRPQPRTGGLVDLGQRAEDTLRSSSSSWCCCGCPLDLRPSILPSLHLHVLEKPERLKLSLLS